MKKPARIEERPSRAPVAAVDAPRPDRAAIAPRPRTCLVVDDSRVIRMVVRRILEAMGLAVVDAADGHSALSACRDAMPDLVVLDWNMPVMDGGTFLAELRAAPAGAAVPVIVCSSDSDAARISAALAAGANEYVMKPFDADILHGKLAQLGIFR
ncbi:MAG: response regulator [Alphaproteobacteria bacterium]|nr:response regulator [Alphaproteobacteria bacterium]MBM3629868.1 response regulator [Alphaproteobacteria bacterium]